MAYTALKQPNLSISDAAGYCLRHTQKVWDVPHFYPKAIDAWNASSSVNHPNQLPPNVPCVVYWTYVEAGVQYGHIATWVPGRGVFSSPFARQYGYEWFGSIQIMTDRIKRLDPNARYLGWSESLSGIKLVINKEQEEMILDDTDHYTWYNALMIAARNRGIDQVEFKKNFVGQNHYAMLKSVLSGPEANNTAALQETGAVATAQNWPITITSLKDQLSAMTAKADQLATNPTREAFDALHKDLVTCNEQVQGLTAEKEQATKTGNAFVRWFTTWLGSLK